MVSPTTDFYGAASGQPVVGGRSFTPAWASGLSSNTWTQLADTSLTVAGAAVVPSGSYLGSAPVDAMLDAYADPVVSDDCSEISMFGGGHYDGSINGILKFSPSTLQYSMAVAPTPPSCYPPSYTAPNAPLIYPSGANPGYFSDALTDPADVAYNAPFNAPTARHMYCAGARRGNKIHYFYGSYIVADLDAGNWAELNTVDFGAQLYAINTNYGTGSLQQGTAVVYDPVTDQFLVTLVPGDAGYNWRVGFFRWNPNTQQIVPGSVVTGAGFARSGMPMFRAGRYVYALENNGINTGWRYHLDNNTLEHFTIAGDTFSFTGGTTAECVAANYHAGRNTIVRWNFKDSISSLYEINLTPTSGAGTWASPYVLTQTLRTIIGAAPSSAVLNYRRIFYHAGANALLFAPRASSNWFAVRLA